MLFHFFKLTKSKSLLLLFLIPVASAVEISVSYLLQLITDTATGKSSLSYLNLVLLVLIYILVDALIYFLSAYLEQTTLNEILSITKNKLLSAMFLQKTGIGHDVKKITTDYYNDFTATTDILRSDYLQGSINCYKQVCQFIIAISLSLMIKPLLSFLIILLCLPGLLLPFYKQKNLKDNKHHLIAVSKKYTNYLQDFTNGLRTIQLFNLQTKLTHIFQQQNQKLLKSQNKDQLTRKQIGGVSQLLDDFLYLGTWVVGIYFVLQKSITLGQLVAFSQLMIFISQPIQSASGLIGDVIGGKEAATKITEQTKASTEKSQSLKLAKLKSLNYENVSYAVSQKEILKNIQLNFDSDKHYLLVGKSGSGKSTLINLPVSQTSFEGEILINNRPLYRYNLSEIVQNLSLLEQDSYLFSNSLKDNLSLYSNKISNQELLNVLKIVGLEKYASVDNLISQNNNFSGGEKRRIVLGRVLLRQTMFNIFDEPLTGLDPKTAHDISQILINLKSGWITVTHQFDQRLFQNADQIIVLDNGSVQAQGTLDNSNIKNWLKKLNLH
ncbi:ABC transporter ATP-binding protein [Companilactobacillus suantsaicola]|uniref:ABC transporter ATP-binding protein n=1 Tax=Companilactobacillus suantsaicola TaxID=2487723 RepID=A0A4Z0JGG8_9LACO|nr:ABC transporter ATP-binding protein [Companilactobacillus suantsaicola]TGD22026.1 ABC transporter ATP-binding protein [Companilactobacillus suantsaicola]